DDGGDELLEETGLETEFLSIQNAAAEDAADDVVAAFVAGKNVVGDRGRDAAGVVGEDAEGDVDVFLFAQTFAFGWDGAVVNFAGECGDFVEERSEDVGVVVRGFAGEVFKAFRR